MPSFYAPFFAEKDKYIVLQDEEFHHAIHVMRKQTGAEIMVTNGSGLLAEAVIKEIHKKQLIAAVKTVEKKAKTIPKIALAFALLKNKHDHLVVEKTTELGISEFFPYTSVHSVRKPSGNAIEKFKKITIAASKQCDNAIFPKISQIMEMKKMVDKVKEEGYFPIAAYEQEKRTLLADVFSPKIPQNCCLIIGPEGGFQEAEIAFLQAHKIPLISLGNHILRAETAAISGISTLIEKCLENDRNYY